MKALRFAVLFIGVVFFSASYAQDTNNDQADVWAVVEAQWNAVERGDDDWMDDMLTDDFAGWANSSPAPRNKASTKMWERVMGDYSEMKGHELFPLSIIVRGDVAVAHYLFSSAREDAKGELSMDNGRFTDVLVRTDDGWKFLAWHGGDDE